MVCIFLLSIFLVYFVISYTSGKIDNNFYFIKKLSFKRLFNNNFLNRGLKFAVSSPYLPVHVCAFFLIPVLQNLIGNGATSDDFPTEIKSYFTVLDFLEESFCGT